MHGVTELLLLFRVFENFRLTCTHTTHTRSLSHTHTHQPKGLYKGMAAPIAGVAPMYALCFLGYGITLYEQIER